MKKIIKLFTAISFASITGLQVSACTSNSEYKDFISEVNNSKSQNYAIFGFLGSKDNQDSRDLQTAIDSANSSSSDTEGTWNNWLKSQESSMKKIGITNIKLEYYQGPYHKQAPSDPVSSFWNDKSISWQKDIFNWILNGIKTNNITNAPIAPKNITIKSVDQNKKDAKNNVMFSSLPIIFLIKNGKLITAGQGWTNSNAKKTETNIQGIKDFLVDNLLGKQ